MKAVDWGVVELGLTSNGSPMPLGWELLDVDILREVGRIPHARVRLRDGDAAEGRFEISEHAFFEPGREIEIRVKLLGGSPAEHKLFTGLVVRTRIEARRGDSTLQVELKDPVFALTQTTRNALFADKSDQQILTQGIIEPAGLKVGEVQDTKIKHLQAIQYDCSDWDFLLWRAEVSGLLVSVLDGVVSLTRPRLDGAAKETCRWGLDEVYELELDADAAPQHAGIQGAAWDLEQQALTSVDATEPRLAQGNLKAAAIAGRIAPKGSPPRLLAGFPVAPEALKAWVDGRLQRERLALLRGRLTVPGTAAPGLLDLIELDRLSKGFNGKALVTGIRHRFEGGGWRTDFQLGLPPEPARVLGGRKGSGAPGLLPPISGLRLAVVAAFAEDPEKGLRVQVFIPGIDPDQRPIWAWLAQPDAGAGRGFGFRPELGDQVVLGFLDSDPSQPVILGALHGPAHPLPECLGQPSAENPFKGLATRSGITVLLDDETPALTIELPSGKTILLDDGDADTLTLSDQNGNTLAMTSEGIAITTDGKLAIDATGDITIKGGSVDIT